MVTFVEGLRDITVFSPSRSLISQLTQWSEQHWMYALRLVSGRHRGNVLAALEGAVFCVIDATSLATKTVSLAEDCISRMRGGALQVAVYTEASSDDALETAIRSTGVLYWAGPLRPEVWENALGILSRPGLPGLRGTKRGMDSQLDDHVA